MTFTLSHYHTDGKRERENKKGKDESGGNRSNKDEKEGKGTDTPALLHLLPIPNRQRVKTRK